MRSSALILGALIVAGCGGASDSETQPPVATETVTATTTATATVTEEAVVEEAESGRFTYADVGDYMVSRGIPFAVTTKAVDDALGAICRAVDGKPVDPQFKAEVLAGLDMPTRAANKVWDTAVEGCYATGHATKFNKPTPSPTPTPKPPPAPKPVMVPGDGTFQVGRDIPAGTYRNSGSRGPGYVCVAFVSTKPNDLGTWLRGSTSKGPAIITVNGGEFFSTQFCKPFIRDTP